MNKKGLWYPIQTLPLKKELNAKDDNKTGKWYPIQTLGSKK
ncbi:hypothetical protein V6C27_05290 [Peptococcaceae bacterium 1198_IL3148]